MSMEQILDTVRGLDGVLELAPAAGSEFPPIAWGDHFFYYAPDGQVPHRQQPYATIVTKDYPGDTRCDLDRPGRWRLNIHVGNTKAAQLFGANPGPLDPAADFAAADTFLPHPLYARQGWIAVINPAARTTSTAMELLRDAHQTARRRAHRRHTESAPDDAVTR
jgi:hypothetical protein